MDPIAWRSAVQIGTSTLKASVAGQLIYPQAFFPFEGKTTLITAGKWLSFAGQEKSTFLVYNLRSCSHPFPFKSLRYEVKNSRARPLMPGSATNGHPSNGKSTVAKDASNQSLVDKDPSNNLAPKIRAIRFEPRFPDLTGKPIWKSVNLTDPTNAAAGNGSPVELSAVGNPGSERRVRPVDFAVIMSSASWEPNSVPEFLQSTVEEIRLIKGFNITLLTESADDGWTVPVTVQADVDGEIDPRLFIEEGKGISRLRRASVFAFSRGGKHICATAIEAAPAHVMLHPTTSQDSEEVWQALLNASFDFLKQSNQPVQPSQERTFSHPPTLTTILIDYHGQLTLPHTI